jgi:putative DNA primase/helicase
MSPAADQLLQGTDAQKIAALAAMPGAQYDRLRQSVASAMGIRVGTLDAEVSKLRRPGDKSRPLTLSDPEPSVEPVLGSELLDSIEQQIATYVVMSEANRVAVVLWILMTYAVEGLFTLPLLLISSPQKWCGKSTLQMLLNRLCRKPLLLSNSSTAAMFRIIEKSRPTLLLDEVDTWLRNDDDQSLRGLINAGHTRDTAQVLRCDGEKSEPRLFDVFAPKAISGINSRGLNDTMTDRSIIIELARRGPNEPVGRLRQDRLNLDHLRSLARRWADDHLSAIQVAEPTVPPELNDRAADNWRPLLALADLAGGSWPERARQAARALSPGDGDEEDILTQLLTDIREIFTERAAARLSSADLVATLGALEARPWGEWKHGKAMTATQLAKLLKPFGVATRNVKVGSRVFKAYQRQSFDDPFARYLQSIDATPLLEPHSPPDIDETPATRCEEVAARSATASQPLANGNGLNGSHSNLGSEVAAKSTHLKVLEI